MVSCNALPGCTVKVYARGKCLRHYTQQRVGLPFTPHGTPPSSRKPNPRSARTQVLAALQAVPTGLTRKQLEASVVGGSVGLALVSLEEQGKVARLNVNGVVVFRAAPRVGWGDG